MNREQGVSSSNNFTCQCIVQGMAYLFKKELLHKNCNLPEHGRAAKQRCSMQLRTRTLHPTRGAMVCHTTHRTGGVMGHATMGHP